MLPLPEEMWNVYRAFPPVCEHHHLAPEIDLDVAPGPGWRSLTAPRPRRSRERTSGDPRRVHAIQFTFRNASTALAVASVKSRPFGAR